MFLRFEDATYFVARNSFSALDLRKTVLYLEPDQFPIIM
jgi:hypothetical protein